MYNIHIDYIITSLMFILICINITYYNLFLYKINGYIYNNLYNNVKERKFI